MQVTAAMTAENIQWLQWSIGLAVNLLAPTLAAGVNAWNQWRLHRKLREELLMRMDVQMWHMREDIDEIRRWRSDLEGRRGWYRQAETFGPVDNGERGVGCNVTPTHKSPRQTRRRKG